MPASSAENIQRTTLSLYAFQRPFVLPTPSPSIGINHVGLYAYYVSSLFLKRTGSTCIAAAKNKVNIKERRRHTSLHPPASPCVTSNHTPGESSPSSLRTRARLPSWDELASNCDHLVQCAESSKYLQQLVTLGGRLNESYALCRSMKHLVDKEQLSTALQAASSELYGSRKLPSSTTCTGLFSRAF